jgi:hypothetical protein
MPDKKAKSVRQREKSAERRVGSWKWEDRRRKTGERIARSVEQRAGTLKLSGI